MKPKHLTGLLLAISLPLAAAQTAPPPDLNHFLKGERTAGQVSETRYQMLTEAGNILGFRGGKAERAWELSQALEARTTTLDALFDFRPLISRQGWLPPVIDEATDVATITAGQIRTANRIYSIVLPERFVSNPPSWRTWLHVGLEVSVPDGDRKASFARKTVNSGASCVTPLPGDGEKAGTVPTTLWKPVSIASPATTGACCSTVRCYARA